MIEMFSSIGFIGTGTMGTAVARAAVNGAQGAPVLLANRTRSKAEAVAVLKDILAALKPLISYTPYHIA